MNYQIFQRSMEGLKEKSKEYDEYGERIAKCEQDINDLRAMIDKANRPVFEGKGGVDQNALDDMLDNWKKEMYTMFARREDLNNLAERVKSLEEGLTSTTDTANTNKEEIEKLKKALDGKLDSDTFDSEISKLTEAIKSAGGDVSKVSAAPGGNLSTKEMKSIKDIIDKFPGFEKALKELKEQLESTEKDIYTKYDNAIDKISSDLKALKDLLDLLSGDMKFIKANGAGGNSSGSPDITIQITNKIEKLEIKLGNLENELDSIRRAKAQTVSMPQAPVQSGSNIEESRIKAIEDKLKSLEHDLKGFNNEIVKEIKNHQDQINGKADYSQLDELRDSLLSKIDDLLRGFKQFADKNETKKALKNLEKQLKNLYDLVMSKMQSGADEDDAMFSKKPLGGFSCASCEKNLINLNGRAPEHYSWNKFPLRDPAERIARVGQGFSKMLSSMKPDTASRFQGMSTKYNQQFYGKLTKPLINIENPDHSQQPVRTQQNFYAAGNEYDRRPESAGSPEK